MIISIMEKIYHLTKNRQAKKSLSLINKKNDFILRNNGKLDNTASKKRCFIIGNGPSINNIDFSRLNDEDVFVVNQIARYKNFNKLKVKYHVMSDPIFFKEDTYHNCALEPELLNVLLEVGKQNPRCITFAATSDDNGVVKRIRENCKVITFPYYSHMEDYPNLIPTLTKPTPWFNNVIQFSIYIAICLGYKEICLLGCEQSTIISILKTKMEQKTDITIYGHDLSEIEKERMKELYNSQSLVSYLSMFRMMYHDFDLLNDFAIKNGVEIINCTESSLLDSFKKGVFDDLISRS